MNYDELKDKAIEVSNLYDKLNALNGQKNWDAQAVMAGFVGDVGDLSKLIMAKNNLRHKEDVDELLAHELSDCLWSVIILAHKLDINLYEEFNANMIILKSKIIKQINSDKVGR